MASREILRLIYEDTGGHCWYCGTGLHPLGNWQVEHQNPKDCGGSDDISNLVAACKPCNRRKSNRTVEEYREYLEARLLDQAQACIDLLVALNQSSNESLSLLSHLEQATSYASVAHIEFYGEIPGNLMSRLEQDIAEIQGAVQ